MIILTLRTDNPLAEIGLFEGEKQLQSETWEAHRQLAETLHTKIATLLQKSNLDWQDIEGVAIYQGPGSFTGLRIGISVANALAYSLGVPCVGEQGIDWQTKGIQSLLKGKNDKVVMPFYGAEAHITIRKK